MLLHSILVQYEVKMLLQSDFLLHNLTTCVLTSRMLVHWSQGQNRDLLIHSERLNSDQVVFVSGMLLLSLCSENDGWIISSLSHEESLMDDFCCSMGKNSSGNKFKQDLTNCQDHRQDCSFLSNSTWLVHKLAYQAVLYLRKARNRLV